MLRIVPSAPLTSLTTRSTGRTFPIRSREDWGFESPYLHHVGAQRENVPIRNREGWGFESAYLHQEIVARPLRADSMPPPPKCTWLVV